MVDISEDKWMKISLIDNWQELYKSEQVKVYSLGVKDCELINEAFDKLHEQSCMIWTTQSTLFTYLCFVVWKTTLTEQKGCVVVDIWALNWITMSDTYSVSSQTDILTAVQEADYIFTVNCAFFFYQWRVKSQNCHKLTVSSHWGQEMFNVTVIEYENSSVYVQWMIDCILWLHCDFFRVYVDNIVIYTKFSLSDHIEHLDLVFKFLTEKGICLSSKKSFLDYLTVQLLDQCVDTLELTTAEDKLAAIVNIEFSHTLFTLEKYLGMTGYLRQYISYYTTIIRSLQEWKMQLNHSLQKL